MLVCDWSIERYPLPTLSIQSINNSLSSWSIIRAARIVQSMGCMHLVIDFTTTTIIGKIPLPSKNLHLG
jgi:hypothetical protein